MRYFMKKRGKLISSISACLALVLMFTSTINGAELVTSDDYVADETVNAAKGTAYGTAGFVTVPKSKQSSKQKTVTSTTLIVIPDSATEAEEFAAKLIQEYVAGIDGSDLEIVRDSEQIGTNYEIYIGNTVNRPHADLTGKADGCYSIRTYNNNSISIYGAGSRGTVAGAYAFLEKFGGYKFYCSEEGYKTSATHLKISGKTDIKYTPAFEVADTNYPIEESSSEEPSEEPSVEEPISEITEDTEQSEPTVVRAW